MKKKKENESYLSWKRNEIKTDSSIFLIIFHCGQVKTASDTG